MKKAWMFLAAGCLALSMSSAENIPVGVKIGKAQVYQPQKYAFAQAATIHNAQNKYSFIIVQSKPAGEKPPRTQFWLSAGPFGFCNLVNFLKITVNGISCVNITPKIEDFVPWQEKKLAGCEAKFNFDGAKVILRFWMRQDSPVFWGSLRPAPDSLEEIKSAQVDLTAIVSMLAKENKKVVWTKVYEREAVTPARTLAQRQKIWELTPQDTYLVLQDKKFDGSSAEKGQGPVMILLDHESVNQAKLFLRSNWTTTLSIVLKPGFRNFEFGLWQQENRISNAEFAEKLKAEKAAFSR